MDLRFSVKGCLVILRIFIGGIAFKTKHIAFFEFVVSTTRDVWPSNIYLFRVHPQFVWFRTIVFI